MLEETIEQLSKISSSIGDDLRYTTDPALLQELSSLIGKELPTDFVELYSQFNGNAGTELVNFVYGYPFNSIQRIIQEAKEQELQEYNYPLEYAGPEIEQDYVFSKFRLQLGDDSGTTILCVDLSPTVVGKYGQVILLDYDLGRSFVVAPSLSSLMNDFVSDLSSGMYKLNEDALNSGDLWLEPDKEIDLVNWYIEPSRWSNVPK